MWDVNLMLLHKIECRSGRVGSGQVSRSCRVVSRVGSGSGRVGSGQGRSGRLRVRFFLLGRASVGRVGIGSDRVGSGRLRVKLWLGWVGPLSVGVGRVGVGTITRHGES